MTIVEIFEKICSLNIEKNLGKIVFIDLAAMNYVSNKSLV